MVRRSPPTAEAIHDAHRIDLGDVAYGLASDREVVLLDGDEVREWLGCYNQLDAWGEYGIEGRRLHDWDMASDHRRAARTIVRD
ncbi:hypothetical protein ER308_04290 [Egibacter rhizosphaerae]|uniref:Uncharacterized protein n=1 Tax=Egibacter rhizosphaerae TaxID=1670831 RepID=A0A411YCC6_9ACTN|nr:hypothetical protein [Egibacter rhizosphaerae]QBI18836.1 hypothetical protein ER308_04290 [Egibacter rhizosphaerae]